MLVQLFSGAVRGIDAYLVRVEVQVSNGLPSFAVVGLPQGAVREGRERVWAALQNVGHPVPTKRITVNLAPADVRKEGSHFDLPIAVALAAGSAGLPPEGLAGTAFVGELGLDGTLRPVRGALAIADACREAGVRHLIVPAANAPEAAVVAGVEVRAALDLEEVLVHLAGKRPLPVARIQIDRTLAGGAVDGPDLSEVRGQPVARRALEVAAAGSHNLLLTGPPGSGKTMLARRLPGILPPMELAEAVEVTRVHSVAGRLQPGQALLAARPFRAPHHTISDAGLVGGGNPPGPGEVSLAHHGVLFLDELPEFRRNVLEALRQPLEDGTITLARARSSLRYPARVVLVAAMNPCPCGHHGDGTERCVCDPAHVERYRGRVSGPLLDRIDLRVPVARVEVPELMAGSGATGEASDAVRTRVVAARARQRERFAAVPGVFSNAQMGPDLVRRHATADREGRRLLERGAERLGLSARAWHRLLKVARTLADLAGEERIRAPHVAEALQFRGR